MAVNVNNVYQKVLALANKEQRGYITPQEFNYFADIAQLEIFENYLHDLKTAHLKPTKNEDFIDEIDMLRDRASLHHVDAAITHVSSNAFTLPTDVYALISLSLSGRKLEEIKNEDEYTRLILNPKTSPQALGDNTGGVFYRNEGQVVVYATNNDGTLAGSSAVPFASYYKKPDTPDWGYVVINGKALYNSATSTNFDLHESEENNLVMRILELSGITLKDQVLTETALRDQAKTKAEKNN
tara:strand:- start:867 stop:1589 length:723 start_codon:yes stop_codon:yes gene_type:complete